MARVDLSAPSVSEEAQALCACGKPATANGRECGFHFRQRLRSIRLDASVTETRSKQNYYDTQAVADAFGEDARERYWDETSGLGAVERVDGEFVHTDYKGERKVATDDVLDFLTDEGEAADVV
jgi:hypothetical protein